MVTFFRHYTFAYLGHFALASKEVLTKSSVELIIIDQIAQTVYMIRKVSLKYSMKRVKCVRLARILSLLT